MNATFAPTSRNPAPVSDSAISSARPPYACATAASSAGCGPIPRACAASTPMTVNSGTVTTRLTTTRTETMRSTRRRGSRSAGASCPSDSSPENASHAAANPVAVSVQRCDAMSLKLVQNAIQ